MPLRPESKAVGSKSPHSDHWQIWIDTGGTFTDCLAVDPHGVRHRAKVLSSGAMRGRVSRRIDAHRLLIEQHWGACDDLVTGFEVRLLAAKSDGVRSAMASLCVKRFDAQDSIIELDGAGPPAMDTGATIELIGHEPAPILAARLVTQTPAGACLPPLAMRLATTRGTNALLQRSGAPTALFITQGFGDLLEIGGQQRPDLFALNIIKRPLIHACSVEVPERMAADGAIIRPLNVDELRTLASAALTRGIRSAAVAFLHADLNPAHERAAATVLKEVGFEHVTCSSEVSTSIRILPRAQTAVVDAYLSPVIKSYLNELQECMGHEDGRSNLLVMTSAGGLVRANQFRASDSLLSGPAGGVAGAAQAALRSGFSRIIGFDMGGTSTDVARYDGDFEYRFEHQVAGVRLMTPALNIHSIAAGGGSICDCIDGRLTVGPHSAGSSPGPACYGASGPLTLTDVNLLLGRLDESQFEIPISRRDAKAALDPLRARIEAQTGAITDEVELLEGLLDIADQRMCTAIEQVSVRQGYDPADYALVAFGGAGGQHACAVADSLGMRTIVLPREASVLSALGLGGASIERFAHRQLLESLDNCSSKLFQWISDLERDACAAVVEEGIDPVRVHIRRRIVSMMLQGQDHAIDVDLASSSMRQSGLDQTLRRGFVDRYTALYGHSPTDRKPIEIESIRVIASANRSSSEAIEADSPRFLAKAVRTMRVWLAGRWQEVPSFDPVELKTGAEIDGPAIMCGHGTSLVLGPGWRACVDRAGAVVASRGTNVDVARARPAIVDQEIFAHRLTSIAVEMGEMLQRTALSVNVKERLDFSCAVLDANGQLVVSAPHIPVHLGALGMCVRSAREVIDMEPGDVIVTNHPMHGGTHLPDVTVVTPAYTDGSELIGYLASRAHHAEIGGTRPGSMPPSASTLAEEGVVIAPRHLIRRNESQFDEIERLLGALPFPSRAIQDNLADLHAAVAANERGRTKLVNLAAELGVALVNRRMSELTEFSADLARGALQAAIRDKCEACERLDDGSRLRVLISPGAGGRMHFDFAGTAPQHAGNLNATPAIVHSVVMYVLRLLIGRDVPLNEGLMRAVHVLIPAGSMLNPHFDDDPARCPAVVGGNTETSQRLVDTLIKALGLCACSQGTMNNVLFGNEQFAYYETICGGAGAGEGFDGASAVHTHMTNTRITDVELIERRYPVRVEQFAIRHGSGGAGLWRGGNGAVRELTFLEPMSLSLLTQHRIERPFGLHSGLAGAAGRQRVQRPNGETIELRPVDSCEVQPGDRLIIETPGGGGWGSPSA